MYVSPGGEKIAKTRNFISVSHNEQLFENVSVCAFKNNMVMLSVPEA